MRRARTRARAPRRPRCGCSSRAVDPEHDGSPHRGALPRARPDQAGGADARRPSRRSTRSVTRSRRRSGLGDRAQCGAVPDRSPKAARAWSSAALPAGGTAQTIASATATCRRAPAATAEAAARVRFAHARSFARRARGVSAGACADPRGRLVPARRAARRRGGAPPGTATTPTSAAPALLLLGDLYTEQSITTCDDESRRVLRELGGDAVSAERAGARGALPRSAGGAGAPRRAHRRAGAGLCWSRGNRRPVRRSQRGTGADVYMS